MEDENKCIDLRDHIEKKKVLVPCNSVVIDDIEIVPSFDENAIYTDKTLKFDTIPVKRYVKGYQIPTTAFNSCFIEPYKEMFVEKEVNYLGDLRKYKFPHGSMWKSLNTCKRYLYDAGVDKFIQLDKRNVECDESGEVIEDSVMRTIDDYYVTLEDIVEEMVIRDHILLSDSRKSIQFVMQKIEIHDKLQKIRPTICDGIVFSDNMKNGVLSIKNNDLVGLKIRQDETEPYTVECYLHTRDTLNGEWRPVETDGPLVFKSVRLIDIVNIPYHICSRFIKNFNSHLFDVSSIWYIDNLEFLKVVEHFLLTIEDRIAEREAQIQSLEEKREKVKAMLREEGYNV